MKIPVKISPNECDLSVARSLSPYNLGSKVLMTCYKDAKLRNKSMERAEFTGHIRANNGRSIDFEKENNLQKLAKLEASPIIKDRLALELETGSDPTLNKIREILNEKHPSLAKLMDATFKQERERHERQNEKVLQILNIKDSIIEDLQRKIAETELAFPNNGLMKNRSEELKDNEHKKANPLFKDIYSENSDQTKIKVQELKENLLAKLSDAKILETDIRKKYKFEMQDKFNELDKMYNLCCMILNDAKSENTVNLEDVQINATRLKTKLNEVQQQMKDCIRDEQTLIIEDYMCDDSNTLNAEQFGILKKSDNHTKSLINHIAALRLQNTQLQAKLNSFDGKTEKFEDSIYNDKEELIEALEIALVKLKSECADLEVEKSRIEQANKLEDEVKSAKIRLLESALNSHEVKSKSFVFANIELEETKENNKILDNTLQQLMKEFNVVKKELVLLRQNEKLSKLMPMDNFVALALAQKLATKKTQVKDFKGLLKRAKLEFDKLACILQICTMEKGEMNADTDTIVDAYYKQQIDRLSAQCKFNESKSDSYVQSVYKLKEEFMQKIHEQEQSKQRVLSKLSEELRQKERNIVTLTHTLTTLNEELSMKELHINELIDKHKLTETELNTHVQQLQLDLNKERSSVEQLCTQTKKYEAINKRQSGEIAELLETMKLMKMNASDAIAQKLLDTIAELHMTKQEKRGLISKVSDMEGVMRTCRSSIEFLSEEKKKLTKENNVLESEAKKVKLMFDANSKEISRLEKDLQKTNIELANEKTKNHTLSQYMKVKPVKNFVIQNNNVTLHEDKITSQSKKCTSQSIYNALVQNESEAMKVVSNSITDLVNELLIELKIPTESNADSIAIKRLGSIIISAEQTIEQLAKDNSEVKLKLNDIQSNIEATNDFDKLTRRHLLLEAENSKLNELLESLLMSDERTLLESMLTIQSEYESSKKVLHQINSQLLDLDNENSELKSELKESKAQLSLMIRESQVNKANYEKELVVARVKAGEEVIAKLAVRDEEIKTYFDSHVAKLILGKEEGTQLLTLSREICSQKLMVAKLQSKLNNANAVNDELEIRFTELKAELKSLLNQSYKKNNSDKSLHMNTMKELDNGQFDHNLQWSKETLKAILNKRATEIVNLKLDITKFKGENDRLKLQIEHITTSNKYMEAHTEIIEDLQVKNTRLTNDLREKSRSMQNMKAEALSNDNLDVELIKLKERLNFTSKTCDQLRTEAELYKRSLINVQELFKSATTPDLKGNEEAELFKLPKLVKALLKAKCNEAATETRVRKLAREQLELQKVMTKLKADNTDMELKIRNYKRLLAENGLEVGIEMKEEQTIQWLKKRIIELEAVCEDFRIKELGSLINYSSNSHEEVEVLSLSKNVGDLLVNGVIVLCNKLANSDAKCESLERLQRVVIRCLAEQHRKAKAQVEARFTVPDSEEGKQTWYISLVDSQVKRIEKGVSLANECMTKVVYSVQDSRATTEAVIELKEEVEALKNSCGLLKQDIKNWTQISHNNDEKRELLSRLDLAENMKVSLEQELAKFKLEVSYNQSQASRTLECTREELDRLLQQNNKLKLEIASLTSKTSVSKRKSPLNHSKKLSTNTPMHEKINIEKYKLEKSMILEEELGQVDRRTNKLAKEVKCTMTNPIESETIKALRMENKELDARLHAELEERKAEIASWIKERAQMKRLIEDLRYDKEKSFESRLNEETRRNQELVNRSIQETDKQVEKYKNVIEMMKNELNKKSTDILRCNMAIEDLKEKLKAAELSTENERTRAEVLASDFKQFQTNHNSVTYSDREQEISILKATIKHLEAEKLQLQKTITEGTKREKELIQEKEKLTIVLKELHNESKTFSEEQKKLGTKLKKKDSTAKQYEANIKELEEKCNDLQDNINRKSEELEKVKCNIGRLDMKSQKIGKSKKELETVLASKEEIVTKLKNDAIIREEDYKRIIEELREEYESVSDSAGKLAAVYEIQLKLIKERFKEEYVLLHNKLAIQSQTKGSLSPKRKEQCELSVELMFQLSQKDAQIKCLEKELAKVRAQKKGREQKNKKLNSSMEVKGKLLSKSQLDIDLIQPDITKKAIEFELKTKKLQNELKTAVCKCELEMQKADCYIGKVAEAEEEIERLRNSLKVTKKEQAELIKTHRCELQKVLKELAQVKSDWKTPEELNECQKEKLELEAQVKELKGELARKKELIKKWRGKEELRQSEAGQLVSEMEVIRSDNEKLNEAFKEIDRKDHTIKVLKSSIEGSKQTEKQLMEENSQLSVKVKTLKTDVGRKQTALKIFREKSEDMKNDIENIKLKDSKISSLKAKLHDKKLEIERKNDQIRLLKEKMELQPQNRGSNDNSLKKPRFSKLKQELKESEERSQQLTNVLLGIFKNISADITKCQSKATMQSIMKPIENNIYNDSLDMLGIDTDEKKCSIKDKSNITECVQQLVEEASEMLANDDKTTNCKEIIKIYNSLIEKRDKIRTMAI